MWGAVMMVLAIVLMREGGLGTLQTMTLLVALPFAMLMLVMCVSLWKGLNADQKYFAAKVTPTSLLWTGEKWRERLGQMLNQTQEKDILKFLNRTALPAMRELRQELVNVHNLNVEVAQALDSDEPSRSLSSRKNQCVILCME